MDHRHRDSADPVFAPDMKLPGAKRAVVERAKVCNYLLCETHPEGQDKARFFLAFGYGLRNWKTLARDLRRHSGSNEATLVADGPLGKKFEVRGSLRTPAGRRVELVTVWILLEGESSPRLVTAYPQRTS